MVFLVFLAIFVSSIVGIYRLLKLFLQTTLLFIKFIINLYYSI